MPVVGLGVTQGTATAAAVATRAGAAVGQRCGKETTIGCGDGTAGFPSGNDQDR